MPTREDIVKLALSFDGYHNNAGYDTANEFSAQLGRPAEASCGDFATDVYRVAKDPFPIMQAGCHTGFAYVPAAWAYAHDHAARRTSWEPAPGDLAIFHWPGGDPDGDHVEVVIWWKDGVLRTIGMNSGPSNVNDYHGVGGVHEHDWEAPAGHGNDLILGTIDTDKLPGVKFGNAPVVVPPKPAPKADPRTLMLKSPNMHGADVEKLQKELNKILEHNVKVDGVFGEDTARAVQRFQRRHEDPMGVYGEHTRALLK